MRKIVLILFVVSLVFGREGYSGFAIPMDRDYGNQRIQDSLAMSRSQIENSWRSIRTPLSFHDDWKFELLKEYALYKTECYNDSTIDTLSFELTWENGAITKDSLIYYAKRTITPNLIIRHRQPSLDGFMEYLREKTK